MRRGYLAGIVRNRCSIERIYKIKSCDSLNRPWHQPRAREPNQISQALYCAISAKPAGCNGENYSDLTARIFLPSTLISMPRGGRRSEPCTIAPRTQTLPGRLDNLSGSKTVRLQGFPTMGCFAGQAVANIKLFQGPRLGHLGNVRDPGVRSSRVGEQDPRIGCGRGNF